MTMLASHLDSIVSKLSTSDHASVVALNLFVALLCACIVLGHLLEENRWMNESITALLIVSSLNCLLFQMKWNHLLNELFGCRGLALVLPFCWLVKEKAHIFLSSVKISSSYIFCHPLYSMQGQSFLHPFEYVTCLVPRVLP